MDDNNLGLMLCDAGEHNMHITLVEEDPPEKSYFLGVCARCGLYCELPIRQIEEIFNGV